MLPFSKILFKLVETFLYYILGVLRLRCILKNLLEESTTKTIFDEDRNIEGEKYGNFRLAHFIHNTLNQQLKHRVMLDTIFARL